jgi:hypothetical protein
MHIFDAWTAHSALGKVFWGTLICVLDFRFSTTSNGSGFQVDVISDVIGAAMILWGLGQLKPLIFDAAYRDVLGFCQLMAALAVGNAILDHWIVPWPLPLRIAGAIFGLLCLVAIYRFCFAMQLFCSHLAMSQVEASWRRSQRLFLWLNLIPAVVLQGSGVLLQFLAPSGRHVKLGGDAAPLAIVAILALILGIVPLIHILLSIWRTRREITDFGGPILPV